MKERPKSAREHISSAARALHRRVSSAFSISSRKKSASSRRGVDDDDNESGGAAEKTGSIGDGVKGGGEGGRDNGGDRLKGGVVNGSYGYGDSGVNIVNGGCVGGAISVDGGGGSVGNAAGGGVSVDSAFGGTEDRGDENLIREDSFSVVSVGEKNYSPIHVIPPTESERAPEARVETTTTTTTTTGPTSYSPKPMTPHSPVSNGLVHTGESNEDAKSRTSARGRGSVASSLSSPLNKTKNVNNGCGIHNNGTALVNGGKNSLNTNSNSANNLIINNNNNNSARGIRNSHSEPFKSSPNDLPPISLQERF